jgi:uncharacterized zinc-type alcohol dehydrogenase-like protein
MGTQAVVAPPGRHNDTETTLLEIRMASIVKAVAAMSATEPLAVTTIERRDVGPRDVLITIEYVGICHTDIHRARSEWRQERYPLVPGHEITGIVADVGFAVTKYAVGDRVGVGCMVDSCRQCVNCIDGREQHCVDGLTETYAGIDRFGQTTHGGYATQIVVTEHFVVKIPDSIGLDEAAPLLCAGISSYSPLRRLGVGPGTRVAIVGLGGVGHIAVKLARAMGADVSVLSHSPKKRQDAYRLGAAHFYAAAEPRSFGTLADSFDLILNTVSSAFDVDVFLSLLRVGGALVNLGVTAEPLTLSVFSLLSNDCSFAGSFIGGVGGTQELLDFCAAHHLGANIELIAADAINEAFERALVSDVRYRFVVDIATLS